MSATLWRIQHRRILPTPDNEVVRHYLGRQYILGISQAATMV